MIELSPRQIPNLITLARIALVFPTTWLLWEARYVEGMILMSIAGASDALDGWLARKFSWGSRFGAAMDPVADKLLVAAMFLVFTWQGHIDLWLTAIVLGRWTPSPKERQWIADVFQVPVQEVSWGHTIDPRNLRYRRYGFQE